MIIRDRADRVEAAEIVLVGIVRAVPCYDIEGCVGLSCGEHLVIALGCQLPLGQIFFESCRGRLEVSDVCEAIGTNRAQLRELKVSLIQFTDVTAYSAAWESYTVSDTSRYHADFVRSHQQSTKLGLDVEGTVLGDDEKVTISRIKGFLLHISTSSKHEYRKACLHRRITGACYKMHTMDPIDLLIKVEWIPSHLHWKLVNLLSPLSVIFGVVQLFESGMRSRR